MRSQEMNKTLEKAGIADTDANNRRIIQILFDAAKEVKKDHTEISRSITGPHGQVLMISRWKIDESSAPYLATIILKEVKEYRGDTTYEQ